ncbi:MAG: hypothetical protein HC897_13420, partial [Thermoanaerobaculia bacterium]|nr:hypothetical protein [Thermoanaerobaculia bacterium]
MQKLPLSVRLTLLSLLLVLVVVAGALPPPRPRFSSVWRKKNARARVRLAAIDAAEEVDQQ